MRVQCAQCTFAIDLPRAREQDAATLLMQHTRKHHAAMPTPLEWANAQVEEVIMREVYSPKDTFGRTKPPVIRGVTDRNAGGG